MALPSTAFTSETGRIAGQRGARVSNDVQRVQVAERRRLMAKVYELTDQLEREDVTELAFAAIVNAGLALAEQRLPAPESSLDAVRLVEIMTAAQKIMRLELGESTANTLTGTVADAAALAERRAQLLAQLAPLDPPPA